jgi:hypothetical protein
MVEMPMMPTQSTADPIVSSDAGAVSDAPQGAFEEMLARRLGRQLVGRFATEDDAHPHDSDASAEESWTPSTVAPAGAQTPLTVAMGVETPPHTPMPPAVMSEPPVVDDTVVPTRSLPIVGGVQPTPVRVHVNRPGFPAPMAEPGIIQPGPVGDVWTHPSGLADLQLTRNGGDRLVSPPAGASLANTVVEPPTVHWSPSPARAALVAAANRDLELDIVTQLRGGLEQTSSGPSLKPMLEVVKSELDNAAGPFASTVASPSLSDAGSTPTTQAPQVQQSALIDRIMNAVELQRHLPPPRAIAIEIPELEGLRLVVTMRMDGSLHIASSSNAQGALSDQAAPLLQAVNDALTERGFDMSADTGGRQGARQEPDDETTPAQPVRASRFRRSVRRSGLRI